MVLNQTKLIGTVIRKQAKISHVDDCQFIVLKVEDIPEDIKSKISDQYSEDFLNDAKVVLFAKGLIDKKKREKIFKCVDKALGGTDNKDSNANTMTVEDFKLLELGDASASDSNALEDTDEAPDGEIEDIINDETADEEVPGEGKDETDLENEDAIGDALTDDIEESMIEEAGLSIDDIIKKGNEHAEKRNNDIAADNAEKQKQNVKSIWVKDIKINPDDENKSVAIVQYTYMDGTTEDGEYPIGTTGDTSGNAKTNISGEKFQQMDQLYKQTAQNLKRAFAKYGIDPTDEDIRISQMRAMFPDQRIKWYYGKDKKDDPMFAFSRDEATAKAKAADNKLADQILSGKNPKAVSKLDILANPKKAKNWQDGEGGKYVTYKNGNTTIYKTESELNEDDVLHQGKSLTQWEQEFKGLFDRQTLLAMIRSGTDLQRLLLTINGHSTLDEAKEEKSEKEDKAEAEDKESDNDKDEGKEDDSEVDSDDASEKSEADNGNKDEEETKPEIPTKWVFLKISLKK